MNVLIIEDLDEYFIPLKAEFDKHSKYFVTYPQNQNDTDFDFNNKGHLIDILTRPNQQGFKGLVDYYPLIDLFIVDATLYASKEDRIGIEFLNYLRDINYRNCEFKFIIVSRHKISQLGAIKLPFDSQKQFVSKHKFGDGFAAEVVNQSYRLCEINRPFESGQKIKPFFSKNWWILLPDFIERHFIHRFNLLLFYLIIFSTGLFALVGVLYDTYAQIKQLIDLLSHNSHSSEQIGAHQQATLLLEYVEHIFLYLLPLFIVFSFLSYYKSTIEINLTGGMPSDVDHDGAMKSLNNSKLILLSSLLSFIIIKIIEKIFEENQISFYSLFSYFVFLVVLITYYIFQSRHHK